ncbi:unnamed protein product [Diamesa serratosioi]
MTEKKALKFVDDENVNKRSSARNVSRRNTEFIKEQTDDHDNGARKSSRISRMFSSISRKKSRQSIIFRPILKFQPTYQTESTKPFQPRVCEKIIAEIINKQMKARKITKFDTKLTISLCRSLSEEILSTIKLREYNRYRIIVVITVGEKYHQTFHQSTKFLWDAENDAVANYVYDRPDIYVIGTVYGIYYD